ncbi:MAG: XdhC family protein [Desulfobacterales bacterium]|nr:XdhC family protein [Desulfobacterales bacterium]
MGTKLLVKADGTLVGTIGGGLLEHEVLSKAQEVLASGRTAVLAGPARGTGGCGR